MQLQLNEIPDIFPDPEEADEEGLVAYGGSLEPEILLSAYLKGIFPWYERDPVLWFSPNPRMLVYPENYKASKTTLKLIREKYFEIKIDFDFEAVIKACAQVRRKGQYGTWINKDMQAAYIKLHRMNYAHSVECYKNNQLVGGLYGLALGKVFCGESMFHKASNASKIAFHYLVEHLKNKGFGFIDAQVPTEHLQSLGGREISRKQFLNELKHYISLDINW